MWSSAAAAAATAPAGSWDLLAGCGVCRERLRTVGELRFLPWPHWVCKRCCQAEPAAGSEAGQGMPKEQTIYCSMHKCEPLVFFCYTCDTMICQDCQLSAHTDHQYQCLKDAVGNLRKKLAVLMKCLEEKHATKEACSLQLPEVQVEVDAGVAVKKIMKELSKRRKVLTTDAQIYFQLHKVLKGMVEEPQGDANFQKELDAWPGKGAETSAEGSYLGAEADVSGWKRTWALDVGDVMRKVPRVSLERLDVDVPLGGQPPIFKVLPGNNNKSYRVILLEPGAKQSHDQQPEGPAAVVKEEQMEVAIENPRDEANDTKPTVLPQELLMAKNSAPRLISPSGSSSSVLETQSPQSQDAGLELCEAARCKVCLTSGVDAKRSQCKQCYRMGFHLQQTPSPERKLQLCQEVLLASQENAAPFLCLSMEQQPRKLSAADQQFTARMVKPRKRKTMAEWSPADHKQCLVGPEEAFLMVTAPSNTQIPGLGSQAEEVSSQGLVGVEESWTGELSAEQMPLKLEREPAEEDSRESEQELALPAKLCYPTPAGSTGIAPCTTAIPPRVARGGGIERFFLPTVRETSTSSSKRALPTSLTTSASRLFPPTTATPREATPLAPMPSPSPTTSTSHGGARKVTGGRSWVWEHCRLKEGNDSIAICNICGSEIRRGRDGKRLGTTSMISHFRIRHHFGKGTQPRPDTPTSRTLFRTDLARAAPHGQQISSMETDSSATTASFLDPSMPSVPALQMMLPGTLEKKTMYSATHPRACQLVVATAKWIARGMLPYSFVETEGFKDFMAEFFPRWKVPSRVYFATEAIPKLYELTVHSVKAALRQCMGGIVHLTMDMWTSPTKHDFMSVTAHWVARDGRGLLGRRQAILRLVRFGRTHIGNNIAEQLSAIIGEWLAPYGLSVGFIVTDNAGNIKNAVQLGNHTRVPCLAHCINLVVQNFLKAEPQVKELLGRCRRLCAHFQHSAAARRALREIQARLSLPLQHLVQEAKTRWNSTYLMLERLTVQKSAIQQIYISGAMTLRNDDNEEGLHIITPQQWNLMEHLVKLLKPFYDATNKASSADASLSEYLVVISLLERRTEEIAAGFEEARSREAARIARRLIKALKDNEYLAEMKTAPHARLSLFLDPRFKRLALNRYQVASLKNEILSQVRDKVLQRSSQEGRLLPPSSVAPEGRQPPAQQTSQGTREVRDLWDLFYEMIEENEMQSGTVAAAPGDCYAAAMNEAEDMYERYIDQPSCLSGNSDPLEYWQWKTDDWPALSDLAVAHLGCPPSAVPSERLLSCIGNKRTSLSSSSLERLAFLQMNRQFIPVGKDCFSELSFSEDRLCEEPRGNPRTADEPEEDACEGIFEY
uniref:B box-type domain-containing protein n=1 Tax=Sphenodon punctatus TaxID=8508 RepID=A0A8D0L4K3_SPHPU